MRKEASTNSQNRRVLGERCVAHEVLARVALRWKVPVLHAIANGAGSYGELRKALPAVTHQMLATRLRELVAEGLVLKVEGPRSASPRYAVTRSGREGLAIIQEMCRWAQRNEALVRAGAPPASARPGGPGRW